MVSCMNSEYVVPSFCDKLLDLKSDGFVSDEQLLGLIQQANEAWDIAEVAGKMREYGREAAAFRYSIKYTFAKRQEFWEKVQRLYQSDPVVFQVARRYDVGLNHKRIQRFSRAMSDFLCSSPYEGLLELHKFPGNHKTYWYTPEKRLDTELRCAYIPSVITNLAHCEGFVVAIHFSDRSHNGHIWGWKFSPFAEALNLDTDILADILQFEAGRGVRLGEISFQWPTPKFLLEDRELFED